MPKIKPPVSSPSIDMTPMVDLAFLLVTFFMLTTQFRPEEAVIVDTPSSISDLKVPESDIMVLAIDKENRVFFNLDNKMDRIEVLQKMGEKYQVSFTQQELNKFANMSSFGVPVQNMKTWINSTQEQRKKMNQPGVPVDSLNNQLADWVHFARLANPQARVAIKGDAGAEYTAVKRVMDILQEKKVNKFNLVTDLENE